MNSFTELGVTPDGGALLAIGDDLWVATNVASRMASALLGNRLLLPDEACARLEAVADQPEATGVNDDGSTFDISFGRCFICAAIGDDYQFVGEPEWLAGVDRTFLGATSLSIQQPDEESIYVSMAGRPEEVALRPIPIT